jgi:hypothetical protein
MGLAAGPATILPLGVTHSESKEAHMALGKRRHEQQGAWVATADLPKSPGHPFYRKLNQLLAEADLDSWSETFRRLCNLSIPCSLRCGSHFDA